MKIKVIEVNQWISKSYIGKMKFSELKKIAWFNIRTIESWGINRDTDEKKIKDIANYVSQEVKNSYIPLFPTPIVVALHTDYWVIIENFQIEIPDDKPELALIIDGQHRFRWIDLYTKSSEDVIDLDLSIVFLIDFDTADLSQIFANINFKQKPVNRSLYYDIFWSLPPGENDSFTDIQISHELVKFLNNYELSPIKGIIKMLGNGNGLVSQAFMVDVFIVFFRKEWIWENFIKIQNKNKIEDFLLNYFSFVKEKFKDLSYSIDQDWKYETNWHVLWKTSGFWAILYLIQDIFLDSNFDINQNTDWMHSYFLSIFQKLSKEEINQMFSSSWIYAKSGGLQNKLYRELSKKLFYNSWKDILKNAIFIDYNNNDYFNLGDIYFRYKEKLQKEFPNSTTIEAKIRRLLQILRDEWYIEFLWAGNYKLIKKD